MEGLQLQRQPSRCLHPLVPERVIGLAQSHVLPALVVEDPATWKIKISSGSLPAQGD